MLGLQVWQFQIDLLLAARDHRRIAARTGHKLGKTTVSAAIGLWWICTRDRGRVVLTSSSAGNVSRGLWRETRMLWQAAERRGLSLGGDLAIAADTGLRYADGRELLGLTTNDAERMAGISGDELLFIIDEASGFPQGIFEAVEGNLSGGGTCLAMGNPTQQSGFFFDAFHEAQEFWETHHASSRDTPNYIEGRDVIPGLATREAVDEMIEKYGEGSPFVRIRVDGEYPETAEDAVIGLVLVSEALRRYREDPKPPGAPLVLGVDVARFGDDDSAIQGVRGTYAYPIKCVHGFDSIEVAGAVLEVVRALRRGTDEIPEVRVDVIGYGSGTYDTLARSKEVRAVAVNVGESPRDKDRFVLKRDEVWFAAREWLRSPTARLPVDKARDAELVAPKYTLDPRGRIRVEGKDAIKKRIKRSPDRADALGLAVYGAPASKTPGTSVPRRSDAAAINSIY